MKINPRHFFYKDAEVDFERRILDFEQAHPNITVTELLSMLNRYQSRVLKYALKDEWEEYVDEQPESRRPSDGD